MTHVPDLDFNISPSRTVVVDEADEDAVTIPPDGRHVVRDDVGRYSFKSMT